MQHVTLSVVCAVLAIMQVGCRSVYRLRCTANPETAGVLAGGEMMGETPCVVKIPRRSELIRHHKVDLTFCLQDGREKTHTVDLHGLKPSNPLAEAVAAPFLAVGAGLVRASGWGEDDDEENEDQDDDDAGSALIGAGGLGVGTGLYYLFGGDGDSLEGYKVHVDFEEPAKQAGNE